MIKQQKALEISLFLILIGLTIFLIKSGYFVCINVRNERLAIEKEAELDELSFKLSSASDYLTSEVQKFAVTLNPKHLRNYWTEVNVTQRREKVISRLKDLHIPNSEFELLNVAKNNSDDLVNIETRAMKLILRVYEVPDEQMEQTIREYHLTEADEELPDSKKVNVARELLYDSNYEKAKEKIMIPITTFEKNMSRRIHKEKTEARAKTNFSLTFLLITVALMILYTFFLTRFMLISIFFPLKAYQLHREDPAKNAEEILMNSQLSPILKNIIKRHKGY